MWFSKLQPPSTLSWYLKVMPLPRLMRLCLLWCLLISGMIPPSSQCPYHTLDSQSRPSSFLPLGLCTCPCLCLPSYPCSPHGLHVLVIHASVWILPPKKGLPWPHSCSSHQVTFWHMILLPIVHITIWFDFVGRFIFFLTLSFLSSSQTLQLT